MKWKWFVAGALALGFTPVSVQAQNRTGPHLMNPYTMNPYTSNSYMMSGYTSGNSGGSGSSPMGSDTSGASMGYGGQGYGGTSYGQSGAAQTSSMSAATVFGLAAKNGRVQWPLGLRSLPPEAKPLRDQLELALYVVASQAAAGQVNRTFIDFGLEAVRDLRMQVRLRDGVMATPTYADAMRFLDRAERGLMKIQTTATGSDGTYP